MAPKNPGLKPPTKDQIGAQLKDLGMTDVASGFLVRQDEAGGRKFSNVKYWGTDAGGYGMTGQIMVPWAKK